MSSSPGQCSWNLPRRLAGDLRVRAASLLLRGRRALRLAARWFIALATAGVECFAVWLLVFGYLSAVLVLPTGIVWFVWEALASSPPCLFRHCASYPSPGSLWGIPLPVLGSSAGLALLCTTPWMVPVGREIVRRVLAVRGLTPRRLTAQHIEAERDVAIRRVMLDRFGAGRYARESGVRPVQEDERGSLYRVEMPDGEPLAVVRVRDATPAVDGTYREYWLRVPPYTLTAREAVAWTFGKYRAEDFAPIVET